MAYNVFPGNDLFDGSLDDKYQNAGRVNPGCNDWMNSFHTAMYTAKFYECGSFKLMSRGYDDRDEMYYEIYSHPDYRGNVLIRIYIHRNFLTGEYNTRYVSADTCYTSRTIDDLVELVVSLLRGPDTKPARLIALSDTN